MLFRSSNTPYVSGSPYDSPHATPPPPSHADPLAAYRASAQAAYAAGGNARQDAALREHSFIGTAEAQLDALIAQGRATWGNLGEQREILKGTQRRLRDAGVTMGLSRNVIVSLRLLRRCRRGKGADILAVAHDRATSNADPRKTTSSSPSAPSLRSCASVRRLSGRPSDRSCRADAALPSAISLHLQVVRLGL